MNGTFGGDLHQLRVLLGRQRASQLDVHVNSSEHAVFGEAIFTILSVDARVAERDDDILQRPFPLASVQANGHGSAGAQPGEQIIVRIRSPIAAANT